MLIPLAVLALGALFAGLAFKECFIGHGYDAFLERRRSSTAPDNKILEEMHHVPVLGGAGRRAS